MTLYKGLQKITPVKVVKKGGDYYVEQVNSDDGTCILNITDADSVNKWKEYYTHMILRDTDTMVVPDGVEEIGGYAFAQWQLPYAKTPLKYITLPVSLTKIGAGAFLHCSQLLLENLPDNITLIGNSAFQSCTHLLFTKLPDKLKVLDYSAFANSNIQITSMPESFNNFTSINVFYSCQDLKEMTFKGDMLNITPFTFGYCLNLTKFSFPNNTSVPTLGNINAIPKGANFTGTIEVPNALLDTWKASTNWAQLTQANWVGI